MTINEKRTFASLEKLGERGPKRYTKEEIAAIIEDPEKFKKAVTENRLAFLMDLFTTLRGSEELRDKIFAREPKKKKAE
ncbi:MAG TPA: hypothetical protein VJ227_01170 [Patescibacteria group bacterium]|nr:hypothetical protein [Patescibacteria group bacterium]